MGYFASNRLGGVGKDDVCRFESGVSIFTDVSTIKKDVLVLDKLSLSPVSGATISFIPILLNGESSQTNFKIDLDPSDPDGDLIIRYIPMGIVDEEGSFLTNSGGRVVVPIMRNTKYLIKISHPNFKIHFLNC